MRITCPRCLRTLTATPDAGPPAFCMYCGQKLRDSSSDPPTATSAPAEHGPSAADQNTGSYVPALAGVDAPPGSTLPGHVPTQIGGYHLLKLLGAGGMGTVYEAEHPTTGHRVAVKLLSPRLAASAASVERFRQEGRLASQLVHPRCVFVLAADTDAGRPYIVMELMPGESLKDLIDRRGPLPFEEAVAHTIDLIDGLAEVHRLGMIHRDVKPSNCFLTADGRVKVGDFGLSKSLADPKAVQLTGSGAFLGTILFASPEQIRGEPLDYASDVYSACATLYYLLCGEAPFHHESPIAALARVISEDAPPICPRRPDVPRDVERVVLRGLDRDRDRRWPSVDELRDALVAVLPSRQAPARPRALVGAYLLDMLLLSLFVMPLGAAHQALDGPNLDLGEVAIDPLLWVLTTAYFALLEGLFGRTAGKALFGLRVSRVGRTGPPGVPRAVLRAVVFALMWFLVEYGLGAAVEGKGIGLWVAAAGVVALLVQWRERWGFRGLHDFASRCHVTRRPQPGRQLRPVSEFPNPLDTLLPAPPDPLPETVAGYTVVGRAWADPSGEQVWAAEDRALGREVLLWLRPALTATPAPTTDEVARTTRLRRLGNGRLEWVGGEFAWTAYAAPAGAPLADTVGPDRPFPWADARYLLEQLVEEFRAAEADGSVPERLGVGHLWVEPNGRIRLLDFPLPTGSGVENACPPARTPLGLLRQVAALALEGAPRSAAGPVRAPVPPHAVPMLGRLFADGPAGYRSLDEFHRDLHETHALPAEVTPSVRAAQLGIQAAALAPGLVTLFGIAGMVGIVLTKTAAERATQTEAVLKALREPDPGAALGSANAKAAVRVRDDPAAMARVEALARRKREEFEDRRRELLRPQRVVLEQMPGDPGAADVGSATTKVILDWAVVSRTSLPLKRHRMEASQSPWGTEMGEFWLALAAVPLAWVVAAAVFRGGLSMVVTGVAVVRHDGRRAFRRQCAVRAGAVWLPVYALLSASVWVQVYHPEQVPTSAALWLIAVGLLPVYVVVALRYPDRPPQDRLAGTTLVPA